jgi:hypothetical protein
MYTVKACALSCLHVAETEQHTCRSLVALENPPGTCKGCHIEADHCDAAMICLYVAAFHGRGGLPGVPGGRPALGDLLQHRQGGPYTNTV